MTQTDQTTAVEQCDREVAADILDEVSNLLGHVGIGQVADLIRDGEYDEHEAVRIAARHRTRALEATQAQDPAVAAELERLKVENAHLSRQIASGILPGLLDADETNELVGFVKFLREQAQETAAPVTQPQIDEHKTAKRLAKIMGGSFVPHKQPVQVEVGDRDEPGAIGDSVRKNREQSTIDFVQDWMMSGDHEPDQWHKDFGAAIDARAAVAPTKSSESALLEEALEALKAAADWEESFCDGEFRKHPWYKKARAILAKADGRAQG